MIDFLKPAKVGLLRVLLQMFIMTCLALEIIFWFFIILTERWNTSLMGILTVHVSCHGCHTWVREIWRLYKLFRSRDMGRAVAVRRWTPTALECYKRGCNCEGCFYRDFFSGSSQKCQMKASVLELVRVIGTPNVELQQFILED